MSVEEKIRKAEEIYYRRRNQSVPTSSNFVESNVVEEKKNTKFYSKMILQIIVCVIIYGTFHITTTNNYIISEDFINKAKEILSQDIDFNAVYSFLQDAMKKSQIIEENNDILNNEIEVEEQQIEEVIEISVEEMDEELKSREEIQNNDENIGGAEEPEIIQLSQMEQDANFIKGSISFIKPVSGTISSMFGMRNPTTATVPKNHTGTDIAAVKGTKIVSATDGKVIYAGNKGDYGKHIKIQIDDIIVLYAHCNKLYVNEGDVIKQGQKIAEVGTTGNTTGPHLHFEIRYQDRYVDPQLVLEL